MSRRSRDTKYALLVGAAGVCCVLPVSAHHSDAALAMDTLLTIEGSVTEFSMRNPHSYFVVASTNDAGETVEWEVQMGSRIVAMRRGWTPDSLPIGDEVVVTLHPSRDGRPYGLFVSVETADGISIPRAAVNQVTDTPDAAPTADTIEGKWIVDESSLVDYPGGLDQLTLRDLTLTEAGRVAADAYSQNSDENPELSCIARPTPGMIIYTDLYPLEIRFNDDETLTIRSQFFDDQRLVYMDGREHPSIGERFAAGHSIGRWEDDVLVVDTTNFADHRSPYQNGIPSGARKHVVERYRLLEGGTRMEVEFVLEDPEFIVGSMTHRRTLVYSPHLDMAPFDCDLEATRRFLPD